MNNAINPKHYTSHESGIECIEISKHLSGCLAQAFQYVWRCGQKDEPVQELKKALWFIDAELSIEWQKSQTANSIIIDKIELIYGYEQLNKGNALKAIALANIYNIGEHERIEYLNAAKTNINNMIADYENNK